MLKDYVKSAIAVLDNLPRFGLRARALIAHSLGALVGQLVQERLLSRSMSLRSAYGIASVLFLAPVPAAPVHWTFLEGDTAATTLGLITRDDPTLGPIVAVNEDLFRLFFFTNFAGQVHPDAPPLTTLPGNPVPEPLSLALQVVGFAPFDRQPVRAGAFAATNGSRLNMVCYSEDTQVAPGDCERLYTHLGGGGANLDRLKVIMGPLAIHDLHVAAPEEVVQAIIQDGGL